MLSHRDAGFNLGILLRTLIGRATPKQYAELLSGAFSLLSLLGELLYGIPAREFRWGERSQAQASTHKLQQEPRPGSLLI